MKILEVSNFFYPKISGSSRYCYELSRRLANNHEVTVLTSQYPQDLQPRETIEGIDVVRIISHGLGWNISSLSFVIPALAKRVDNYDIIHLHSYLFLISNQTGFLRLVKPFPLYLHLHGGTDIPPVGGFKPLFKRYLYDPLIGTFMLRVSDTILSISKNDIRGMENAYWIPNGVEPDDFQYRIKNHDKLQVGYIGRLEAWKGAKSLPYIVNNAKKKVDVEFHIVGDGPLLHYVERNCDATCYGQVPFDDIPDIFKKIDVLILPSLIEGVPTVILEAFSSGCPVVARNVGSVSELVSSDTGFLVDTDDEFVKRIVYLAKNRDRVKKMGKKGRKLVEEYYAWNKVVERFETVIS